VAGIGTDLDHKIREAAANKEHAWVGAGKQPGLQIWRIEQFHVKDVPKETYGTFYSGDSYIVLSTYKKPNTEALAWDAHFWLGKFTTQDEAGTAAYKTVELDDFLHGAPAQHREVQGYESDLFVSYFKGHIKLLEGGVESGFKHHEPEKYTPRLLHLRGRKKVRVTQVEFSNKSLCVGDVFILDAGLDIYQFNGKGSPPMEKMKAAQLCRSMDDERKGASKIRVIEDGDKSEDSKAFWKYLGGEIAITKASSEEEEKKESGIRKLFQLSDAASPGNLQLKEIASGKISKKLLSSSDVFIFDTGAQVYVWIGKSASVAEKKKSLSYAQDYLVNYKRPLWLPISRLLEGGESDVFKDSFDE